MTWRFDSVFLARHGETVWNRERRRQEQLDSPLTDIGIRHAQAIASIAGGLAIDHIFSSPLGRAESTANFIAAHTNLSVQLVEELVEIHHGEFAGLTNSEIENRHPGVLALRAQTKYTWSFPRGESYRDADQRAARVLDRVEKVGSRRPLLVTHEMVGLMLLRRLLDLTPDVALSRSIPQGVILKAEPRSKSLHLLVAE